MPEVKPLCIDLFCGKFGWGVAFAAEGYRIVGFDLAHEDYHGLVPEGCSLVLQDVLTLHGSQFRDAAVIVASPPCQAYSYRTMPWKRAKALPPPSNELFDACFRIQREASEAAGCHIPMVVENVCGAQKWVGRAAWHYGSFYLWGDVPALMPPTFILKQPGRNFHFPEKYGIPSPSSPGASHEPSVTRDYGQEKGFAKEWRDSPNGMPMMSSKSSARKAASAEIARIPYPLAQHIARVFKPTQTIRVLQVVYEM